MCARRWGRGLVAWDEAASGAIASVPIHFQLTTGSPSSQVSADGSREITGAAHLPIEEAQDGSQADAAEEEGGQARQPVGQVQGGLVLGDFVQEPPAGLGGRGRQAIAGKTRVRWGRGRGWSGGDGEERGPGSSGRGGDQVAAGARASARGWPGG